MKTAFITGITGQDGSYLAEFLLKKNYKIVGLVSKKHGIGEENIRAVKAKLVLEKGDLLDKASLEKIFRKHKPQEVYNLAALSFIPACWQKPALAFDINALGVLRLLTIIKEGYPKVRFFQASSSKIFGKPKTCPQDEETKIDPIDPYGISKAAAHFLTQSFRKNFSLFAVSGISYNHESLRRGEDFVTRKISLAAVKIKLGLVQKLRLGNLNAKEDWGWAPDYVRAMWLMLQQKKPDDYIIATGNLHSVREICQIAFGYLGLDYKKYTVRDKMFFRKQAEVKLCGAANKAKKKLGWQPTVSFKGMIKKMVEEDVKKIKNEIPKIKNTNKI